MLLITLLACKDGLPQFQVGAGTGSTVGGGGGGGGDDSADSADSGDSGGDFPPEECGVEEGDVACDMVGLDGAGTLFTLYSWYGTPGVVVMGNAWDSSLVSMSASLADWQHDHDAHLVIVLFDAIDLTPADSADAAQWSNTYGVQTVADSTGSVETTWSGSAPMRAYGFDADLVITGSSYGYTSGAELSSWVGQ